jgi:hypothetical protein
MVIKSSMQKREQARDYDNRCLKIDSCFYKSKVGFWEEQ